MNNSALSSAQSFHYFSAKTFLHNKKLDSVVKCMIRAFYIFHSVPLLFCKPLLRHSFHILYMILYYKTTTRLFLQLMGFFYGFFFKIYNSIKLVKCKIWVGNSKKLYVTYICFVNVSIYTYLCFLYQTPKYIRRRRRTPPRRPFFTPRRRREIFGVRR